MPSSTVMLAGEETTRRKPTQFVNCSPLQGVGPGQRIWEGTACARPCLLCKGTSVDEPLRDLRRANGRSTHRKGRRTSVLGIVEASRWGSQRESNTCRSQTHIFR